MKTTPPSRTRQGHAVSRWVFAGFALVALFFLVTEHRAHLYGWLPYLLLAACPLMHLFHGHGGHGSDGSHGADRESRGRDEIQPPRTPANADATPVAHRHH